MAEALIGFLIGMAIGYYCAYGDLKPTNDELRRLNEEHKDLLEFLRLKDKDDNSTIGYFGIAKGCSEDQEYQVYQAIFYQQQYGKAKHVKE
jgi:hypothetical protein